MQSVCVDSGFYLHFSVLSVSLAFIHQCCFFFFFSFVPFFSIGTTFCLQINQSESQWSESGLSSIRYDVLFGLHLVRGLLLNGCVFGREAEGGTCILCAFYFVIFFGLLRFDLNALAPAGLFIRELSISVFA